MLSIETLYDGPDEPADTLELCFDYRTRSRLRARTLGGVEVGLFLPRGTILRDGQKLRASDGSVILVRAAVEALTEARCPDPLLLARAAYHLGNRHVAVQLGDGWLRIAADHVLGGMLVGLGVELRPLDAPFEPEAGAYAHGHQHAGETASPARIHEYRKSA